ncbi:MAG: response regulator [Syntrophomonadaceae bacterium]|nr:response regulator [Syntrophomonadaceae bacterium]
MEATILIVDDQKGVRLLLEELFTRDMWKVYLAANGQEAVKKTAQIKPDIILMDMKMPIMNGLEAAKAILTADKDQIIVMMTAYGEMDVVNKIIEAGVKKCIAKPFDIMLVRELMRDMVINTKIVS